MRCAPGLLAFNQSLCIPCPPGYACTPQWIMRCALGTWSRMGAHGCTPCTQCPEGSFRIAPCAPEHDTECHRCMGGFVPRNDSCVVQDEEDDYGVALFLILVAEILLCATFCRWWKTSKYEPIPNYV